jgi:hypothetical protein
MTPPMSTTTTTTTWPPLEEPFCYYERVGSNQIAREVSQLPEKQTVISGPAWMDGWLPKFNCIP